MIILGIETSCDPSLSPNLSFSIFKSLPRNRLPALPAGRQAVGRPTAHSKEQ